MTDILNGIGDDRCWAAILTGRRTWGFLDISPTRHGVTRYRSTVLPPGIDRVERRLLRTWLLAQVTLVFARIVGVRDRVRGLGVVRMAGHADPRTAAPYAELCPLVALLDDADGPLASRERSLR